MTVSSTRARFLATAVATALLLLLLLPASVAAHAELDVPTPADGATVEGTPVEIFGTFTQSIKPAGSSLVLRDGAGGEVARGGLDPDDEHRMVITDVPELAPGEYVVEWTTMSAEDDELARGTWAFTVTAAPTPTPIDSPPPSASPSPSTAPSPTATAEPTSAASPSASPAPTDPGETAGGDAILSIVVALAIVLIAAVYLLSRRGRPSAGA